MPSLGFLELLVIGVILIVVVGPERLPHATRWMGRAYGQMRRAADELRRALVLEADRLDEEDRLKDLRQRREEAMRKVEEERGKGPGTPQAQPEAVIPMPEDEPRDDPAIIPPGFSEQEWGELPDHVRDIVRRRSAKS